MTLKPGQTLNKDCGRVTNSCPVSETNGKLLPDLVLQPVETWSYRRASLPKDTGKWTKTTGFSRDSEIPRKVMAGSDGPFIALNWPKLNREASKTPTQIQFSRPEEPEKRVWNKQGRWKLNGGSWKRQGYPESVYNCPHLLLTTVSFLQVVGNWNVDQFSRESLQLVSEQNNCLSKQQLFTVLRNVYAPAYTLRLQYVLVVSTDFNFPISSSQFAVPPKFNTATPLSYYIVCNAHAQCIARVSDNVMLSQRI